MKRTNPTYFLFFLLGLFVMFGGITFVVISNSQLWYTLLIGLAIFFLLVFVSIRLSNGTLEQRHRIFKECIECNQEIESDAEYCKHCGANQEATIICEFCGGECHSNDSVCKHCNALLK